MAIRMGMPTTERMDMKPITLLIIAGLAHIQSIPLNGSEIERLRSAIQYHDHLYYQEAAPEIPDDEYDELRRRLDHLETIETVGEGDGIPAFGDDRISGAENSNHLVPMQSLRKLHGLADLERFHVNLVKKLGLETIQYRVEPKIDGVAISAVYADGKLVRVLTRGNGKSGSDVTQAIRRAKCLPETVAGIHDNERIPGLMELRGEAYIPIDTFERLNRERTDQGLAPYSNSRNLAAGTLRVKDDDSAVKRGLRVLLFSWGAWLEGQEPVTEADFHDRLRKWGFPVIGSTFSVQSFEELVAVIKQMEDQREDWAFASDGVVIELEQSQLRQEFGRGRKWPNWAAAYKFPSLTAETVIQNIIWQTGETGRRTPVAIVHPVNLDGRTISRINLYNQSYMDRLKVEIGKHIVVELRGHVIPAIREVVGDSGK